MSKSKFKSPIIIISLHSISHLKRNSLSFSSNKAPGLQSLPKTMVHIVKIHHTTYVGRPPRPLFNVGVKNRQGMKNKKSPGKDPKIGKE